MSGIFGLLDDVAAIAKLAAASIDDVGAASGRAAVKAAGVVIDDTAVTPQYVQGIAAEREIPIVRKIALGSIRNKLLVILPVALVLSQWAPGVLPYILLAGGCYLGYEGAEKVLGWIGVGIGHGHDDLELEGDGFESLEAAAANAADEERKLVAGAVRTDLILSTEIMLISLDSVADQSFWSRLTILVVVALVMTVGVYGVVALIVKMDDLGLVLARRTNTVVRGVGRGLVSAMPHLLTVISVVGTVAMLWVGGHLLVDGVKDIGWHGPHDLIHHLAHPGGHFAGGVLPWFVTTGCDAVVGLAVGLLVLTGMTGVKKLL